MPAFCSHLIACFETWAKYSHWIHEPVSVLDM
jgi:hypothetical protein